MITSMNKICTYHIYIIYVQNVFYTYIESWYRSVCVSVFVCGMFYCHSTAKLCFYPCDLVHPLPRLAKVCVCFNEIEQVMRLLLGQQQKCCIYSAYSLTGLFTGIKL